MFIIYYCPDLVLAKKKDLVMEEEDNHFKIKNNFVTSLCELGDSE